MDMKVIEVNGVRLHYLRKGEGKPVVLIHGNGEDHHLFDRLTGQLTAAGYQVIAPDSRGHGLNTPLQEYHYADMAEDIFQLISALGLGQPAYYGHSDGGIIGLLLALRHPDALHLMAVSGTNLSPAGIRQDWLETFRRENEEKPDPLITLMLQEPDIPAASLRAIRIPVLVTAGSDDLILPAETRRIADNLPAAETVILEGEDHGSYISGSDTIGDLLIGFFNKHGY